MTVGVKSVSQSYIPKLRRLLSQLQKWGKTRIHDLDMGIKRYEEKLLLVQSQPPTDASYDEEREIYIWLNKLLLQKDLYWKQRATNSWLCEGDKNTRLFHLSATAQEYYPQY